MATWSKEKFPRENGDVVEMQTPEIISASRSTDIPAFYADWFFHRLRVGYSAWLNPFNRKLSYVSYSKTRFIVFWTKNPAPLLSHLQYLKERNINCYIQFSLNDYDNERLEPAVPKLQIRIDTFKRMVDALGYGGVVWRFDPLVLTDKINIELLLEKIRNIGEQLHGYTEKLVFSFVDINAYRKVRNNLINSKIDWREWDETSMCEMAKGIAELNNAWKYKLGTCGEKIDLQQFGIQHNHCVDLNLIVRRAYNNAQLMKTLKVDIHDKGLFDEIPIDAIELPDNQYATIAKRGSVADKGQRAFCGCIISKDIGEYNTCVHLCEYCYANANKNIAQRNYATHRQNPNSETITGI